MAIKTVKHVVRLQPEGDSWPFGINVPVKVTCEVPEGFDVESLGMRRGKENGGNGKGYVTLDLSISARGQK